MVAQYVARQLRRRKIKKESILNRQFLTTRWNALSLQKKLLRKQLGNARTALSKLN